MRPRGFHRDDAEERFRSAFENAPIGMTLVSVEPESLGRFLMVNEATCELLGLSREQLLTTDFQAVTHPADLDEDLELMRQLIAGEIPSYQLEKRYIHAEHHAVWVLVSSSLVTDAAGGSLYVIRQLQDIGARKQFEGQLEYLADHDPLTGLFNRRRFNRELERQLVYSRRYGTGGAVLVFDLDQLKRINDAFGHSMGDHLLTRTAELLLERVRSSDVVGRLGGDEFAVALLHTERARATELASGLLTMLADDSALTLPSNIEHTASVGLAMFAEDSEASATDLIIAADRALYEAKHDGGNAVVVYEPGAEPGGVPAPLPNWAAHIRSAITEDAFLLYGQPVVDLRTDAESQREILCRLPTPAGEVLLPGTFYYTAERHGFVRELDRWVISHALPTLSTGLPGNVSINLAADSVADPDLGAFVRAQLAAHDVDPDKVIFEITETAAIANMESARRCLSALTGIGCRVALDDFGAGFGSFYHLKHLELQFLKVDGEFIRTLRASKTDQLMVRHIVEIAHGLGQQAIAEHVEDEPTLELVRELDFDLAQGNFLGRAAPLELATWAPASISDGEPVPHRAYG